MKSVTTILAVLCFAHLQYANANVKVLHKSHIHLDKKLVFTPNYYIDERLTYALCDTNPNPKELKCTIKREKKAYENDEYSCNVVLKTHNENGTISNYITVSPFGQDNAILIWQEQAAKQYLKFTTVQMSSCKYGEATIDLKSDFVLYKMQIVGYNDTFDAFYKGSRISCADKVCKVTINADGQIIDGPRPFVEEFDNIHTKQQIFSISKNSSSKGYFYLKKSGNQFIDTLLTSDGIEKSLDKHALPKSKLITLLGVSINNNLIRTCYELDSKYICNQYDHDGNSKLETMVPDFNEKAHLIDIYNAPSGGFYVLSFECTEFGKFGGCTGEKYRLIIERIDASGKKTGSFDLKECNYSLRKSDIAYLFYENETKDTCLSFVAHDANNSGQDECRLLLTANCFNDADFGN